MKAKFLPFLIGAALIGCAHTPVRETVEPYQGEPIESAQRVTFDGEQFAGIEGDPLGRGEVQAVHFALDSGKERKAAAEGAGDGLSPLALDMLERGRAMAASYPGVSGVVLVDDGEFVYNKDGTNYYRYHFAGLVLKEEMKSWAQFTSGFREGRSRVNVLFARAIAPDGTVTTLSPDALQVGSPSEQMQFFNPTRKILSGVIPGVEVGSIVEYSYEYDLYDPEAPELFFPGYFFQGSEPVVYSRVHVKVPKEVPFNYMTRGFAEGQNREPTVEGKGRDVNYTWVVEDSPPVVKEPMMPPMRDVVPMMEGSVFKDFAQVFAIQRKLQEPRMELTPEIEAKVNEITVGAEDVDEKIARIYHWMQENTRYVSIKGSLGAGWSGHTAQETFANRYGDCTDKGILFATMCKAIGVESYPIILRTNDAGVGVTEIPTMDGNHCISEVDLAERRFYLDSTAENYRYPYFRADDHGAFAINAVRGDIKEIPVPTPEDNQRLSRLEVTLEPNGDVYVKTRNKYNGTVEAGVRGFWKTVREDDRAARMTDYVNSISPGALLDTFELSDINDLSEQLSMTIDYALPQHAVRAKQLMYLRMPTLEREYPEAALETRRYAIQYMTTEERILEIDLKLPERFHSKWLPPPLEISNPYLDFQAAYEEANGTIQFRETYRRLKRIVPVEDYPVYRDALRAIAAFSKKEIFLTAEEG